MALRKHWRVMWTALLAMQVAGAAPTITAPTITPGTITFSSNDPDSGSTSGSSTAAVVWGIQQGNANSNWTLTVQSTASTLALCPNVPASAIKVQCTGLTSTGTGNPTGTCAAGALTLSTSPQTLASGNRQGATSSFTATISFTFTDSWKYPASSSCSLSLTYTVTAN